MAARNWGKADVLNKKVPENPRYKSVKSVIDTGASMSKQMAKLEDIRKNYRYKKGELFKRMKATTFVQLVLQVQSFNTRNKAIASQSDDRYDETQSILQCHDNNGAGDVASPVPSLTLTEGDYGESQNSNSPRSTLQSVIQGVGEYDLNEEDTLDSPKPPTATEEEDCPYLVLDLRDSDAYQQCHIITARNYPTAMLSRSVNNYTKEMISFRNQPGKIIIIYDEDERLATTAATTLVQRGFDNVFILSGGLKVAVQKFPNGLVTGTLPSSCKPSPPSTARKTARKPSSEPIIAADKTDFTEEDLAELEFHQNEAILPRDAGSRLSRPTTRPSSTTSNTTVMTNRSTASSTPWK